MLVGKDGRLTCKGLEAAGNAAFGERWKSPLANILGLQSSRIRDVMRGARPAPVGWTPKIKAFLENHIKKCQEALDSLEKEMGRD